MPYVIDLTTLTTAQGFVIQGDADGDRAGFAVSSAGDVNGDGFDDVIVGAPFHHRSVYERNIGEAYVIYGSSSATRGRVDVASLSAADGFVINGVSSYDRIGFSVSAAGDVNNDGLGDIIVGTPYGNDGGLGAGEAYVIYGTSGATRGGLDLTSFAAADGFVIQGDAIRDYAGWSVSAAGDVNGDGIDDLILGAPEGDDAALFAGEAYVIYGTSNTTRGRVDLTNLAAADGFIIQGAAGYDSAGRSVSSAGDVNGDGIDDVIVGAPDFDGGDGNAGAAFIIYGKNAATRGMVGLANLSAADGFIIQGDAGGDNAGRSVSSAGDVNGDGIADLIISAHLSDRGGDNGGGDAGGAYVVYGKAGTTRALVDLSNLSPSDGFFIQGDRNYDLAGWSVSSAGDVNGDGIDDVIVGQPDGNDASLVGGEAYLIYGKAGKTRGTLDLANLADKDGFIIRGDAGYDKAGYSVSSAGDVNGDGFDDLIVGAPLGDDGGSSAGEAYIIYGFSRIIGAATADRLTGTALRDTLVGLAGNDTLDGGAGNDVLSGGAGPDQLRGGLGADRFEFTNMRGMTTNIKASDVILDFKRGQDKTDLSAIDASTLPGNNTFTFDGTKPFGTSKDGDIYYKQFGKGTGGHTRLSTSTQMRIAQQRA